MSLESDVDKAWSIGVKMGEAYKKRDLQEMNRLTNEYQRLRNQPGRTLKGRRKISKAYYEAYDWEADRVE